LLAEFIEQPSRPAFPSGTLSDRRLALDEIDAGPIVAGSRDAAVAQTGGGDEPIERWACEIDRVGERHQRVVDVVNDEAGKAGAADGTPGVEILDDIERLEAAGDAGAEAVRRGAPSRRNSAKASIIIMAFDGTAKNTSRLISTRSRMALARHVPPKECAMPASNGPCWR
jgi:hypothetical protein